MRKQGLNIITSIIFHKTLFYFLQSKEHVYQKTILYWHKLSYTSSQVGKIQISLFFFLK